MMNIEMKPIANFIAAVKRICPPHSVAIQLKIFTPVGIAISMVESVKNSCPASGMPTVNMWCAQTMNDRNAIDAIAYTIASYPKIGFLENVVTHPVFMKGNCDTSFIEKRPELLQVREKKDRASKVLKFLGDVIVNGSPGVAKPLKSAELMEARVPEIDITSPTTAVGVWALHDHCTRGGALVNATVSRPGNDAPLVVDALEVAEPLAAARQLAFERRQAFAARCDLLQAGDERARLVAETLVPFGPFTLASPGEMRRPSAPASAGIQTAEWAIAETDPLSSISLPNSAPSSMPVAVWRKIVVVGVMVRRALNVPPVWVSSWLTVS